MCSDHRQIEWQDNPCLRSDPTRKCRKRTCNISCRNETRICGPRTNVKFNTKELVFIHGFLKSVWSRQHPCGISSQELTWAGSLQHFLELGQRCRTIRRWYNSSPTHRRGSSRSAYRLASGHNTSFRHQPHLDPMQCHRIPTQYIKE